MKTQIKSHYTVLHFDEYPILFCGLNQSNRIVVGSFVFEAEEDTFLYFHSIVDTNSFRKFFKRKLSYVDLLQRASHIEMVVKDINENILDVISTKLTEIEPDWLPLKSAYCPEIDEVPTFFSSTRISLIALKPNEEISKTLDS